MKKKKRRRRRMMKKKKKRKKQKCMENKLLLHISMGMSASKARHRKYSFCFFLPPIHPLIIFINIILTNGQVNFYYSPSSTENEFSGHVTV
jgi:hypothetical protein